MGDDEEEGSGGPVKRVWLEPRLAPVDNRYLNYAREMCKNERKARVKWYVRTGQACLQLNLQLAGRAGEVSQVSRVSRPVPRVARPSPFAKKKHPGLGMYKSQLELLASHWADSLPEDSLFTPKVEPSMKAMIYQGLTKDGREAYLKARGKIRPCERYTQPPLSEWAYGWHQDVRRPERLPMSKVPRPHYLGEFRRRHGVLHLPELTSLEYVRIKTLKP